MLIDDTKNPSKMKNNVHNKKALSRAFEKIRECLNELENLLFPDIAQIGVKSEKKHVNDDFFGCEQPFYDYRARRNFFGYPHDFDYFDQPSYEWKLMPVFRNSMRMPVNRSLMPYDFDPRFYSMEKSEMLDDVQKSATSYQKESVKTQNIHDMLEKNRSRKRVKRISSEKSEENGQKNKDFTSSDEKNRQVKKESEVEEKNGEINQKNNSPTASLKESVGNLPEKNYNLNSNKSEKTENSKKSRSKNASKTKTLESSIENLEEKLIGIQASQEVNNLLKSLSYMHDQIVSKENDEKNEHSETVEMGNTQNPGNSLDNLDLAYHDQNVQKLMQVACYKSLRILDNVSMISSYYYKRIVEYCKIKEKIAFDPKRMRQTLFKNGKMPNPICERPSLKLWEKCLEELTHNGYLKKEGEKYTILNENDEGFAEKKSERKKSGVNLPIYYEKGESVHNTEIDEEGDHVDENIKHENLVSSSKSIKQRGKDGSGDILIKPSSRKERLKNKTFHKVNIKIRQGQKHSVKNAKDQKIWKMTSI
ncbi:hypothetical protein EDEG_02298 [Edhazardia aedis USNM 41457]|uniref:Uncharacterized protein n=1 Tax=Edhazardia aedis (strain USNM 41457) TaxID=1003232 RepID=J9D6D6_EDHAE|nr:hypothetical protein EDEG_02298 [Edhazardia aedis USNM 41457]|eukprot:EJW03366.1 hypothetical protein EDEG_02298 [Edhazardia aedis USNM 41457]